MSGVALEEDVTSMIGTLAVAGYRSLRDIVLPLGPLTLVTGPNGSGKSSLYRALRLLADVAQGRAIQSLAHEGGLPSTLWAGPETVSRAMRRGDQPVQGTPRKSPVSLRLGFAGVEFGYAVDLGLPPQSSSASSAFSLDPEIKTEVLWAGATLRPSTTLVERRGGVVRSREHGGDWALLTHQLSTFDSMMTHCADPRQAPEMLMLREQMRGWRFYDQFRTDQNAPARHAHIGTRTPVLANDGADVAAAIQTIAEIGDRQGLDAAVADAFPGAAVSVTSHDGRFALEMHQHGLLRPLGSAELSDGTLRYILWVAALLTPRPPAMLVLNEPETSLHPDLLPPLGRLIVKAARATQVVVVSHAAALIDTLLVNDSCHAITLAKELGETTVDEATGLDRPIWKWPPR
jgi:predicted ATPase